MSEPRSNPRSNPGPKADSDASVPMRSLATLAVLIPAWQPTALLVPLIAELAAQGFGTQILVDDGSGEAAQSIFREIAARPNVEVLRHAVNLGKGRALKTGFGHLLNRHPECFGVVTADADGQHTPADIVRVAWALLAGGERPVLGSRGFEGAVPLRSRLGNLLTRKIFRILTGTKLSDTQTGLRGLPRRLLPELLALDGERYEYEMTTLAHLCRSGQPPVEVPIATVYTEDNRGSHFHPVWDSLRITFVLLRSFASSLRSRARGASADRDPF